MLNGLNASAECDGSESAAGKEGCLHARYLEEHPEALQRFTTDLLSLLLQVYSSTVAAKVCPRLHHDGQCSTPQLLLCICACVTLRVHPAEHFCSPAWS